MNFFTNYFGLVFVEISFDHLILYSYLHGNYFIDFMYFTEENNFLWSHVSQKVFYLEEFSKIYSFNGTNKSLRNFFHMICLWLSVVIN